MNAGAAGLVLLLNTVPVTTGEQGTAPRWAEIPALCARLQKEGWRPSDPLGAGQEDRADVRVGGNAGIYLCRVKRALPAARPGKRSELEVFLQHGGGDNLSVMAHVWREPDRQAVLAAAAELFQRVARDLRLTVPADLVAALRVGDTFDEDLDDLTFRVWVTTREEERRSQPDLKPEEVPLLAVDVTVAPVG